MGSVGISVKVWQLGWDPEQKEFLTSNSSVFVFQDRSPEDLAFIQTVVRTLTGDESLEGVFTTTLGLLNGVKGDVVAKGEPKREAPEPLDNVKLEMDEDSDDDDAKDNVEYDDDDNDNGIDWDDDENNDDEDYDGKEYVGKKEEQEVETCDGCGRTYQKRGMFRKHLEACNPEQIGRLPPRYTLRQAAKMRSSVQDGRSQPRSVERRLVTLAKAAEPCNKCGRTFKHRSFLIHHLKSCNPEQIPELVQQKMSRKVAKRMQAILDEGDALKCNFCPRRFTFKKSLEKHENLHRTDPDSPRLSDKNFKKNSTPAHLRVPMGNYQCDKCSSSFKLYAALERHMEAHMLAATEKPKLQDENTDKGVGLKTNEIRDGVLMRCIRCDLVYTTRGMYQQHMKQYHSKALACEECGKKFTLPNSLNTHRLNHHTSFPKDCDDCGQFCATKKEYMGHMKIAHGQGGPENTVPCEICGKLVKSKYSLKSHVKLVHEKNGAYFPCDKCGKVLKSKGSLEYHSKVHTGEYKFRCDECGHGYMRFDQMQDCKNTHAGIFKFNCPHCEYKTNKSKALANHITTHSAAKPWICPICQHTSSTTSNLNNHIKKVHKMTLCQAEAVTKRSRYGREMTEDEIEQNLILVQRGASTLETKELYSDSQQQAVNMKILESRKKMKDIRQELSGGGAVQEERHDESPTPEGHLLEPPGHLLEPALRHHLDLGARQLDLTGRPPLFLPGAQKYF